MKHPRETLTRIVVLRLTEKQHARLCKNVERSGLSREKYLRNLINGYTVKEKPRKDHTELLRQISGLCTNANQIAHRVNSKGVAARADTEAFLALTKQLWQLVHSEW